MYNPTRHYSASRHSYSEVAAILSFDQAQLDSLHRSALRDCVEALACELWEDGKGPRNKQALRDLISSLIDEAEGYQLDEQDAVTEYVRTAVPLPRPDGATDWPDDALEALNTLFLGQFERVSNAAKAVTAKTQDLPSSIDDALFADFMAPEETE